MNTSVLFVFIYYSAAVPGSSRHKKHGSTIYTVMESVVGNL